MTSQILCPNGELYYCKSNIYKMRVRIEFIRKLFIVFLPFLLFSCNKDDLTNDNVVIIEPAFKVVKIPISKLKSSDSNFTEDEYVLQFRSQETFEETINTLDTMTLAERTEWTEKISNFNSIAQIYDQAMAEAESYYDRPGGYEEFKAKYNMLYFPEEGEDYGAYIPYKNDIEVYCANENGRLMIGEDVINIDPLTTYEELIEAGRAMIEVEPSGVFEIEAIDSLLTQNKTTLRSVLGNKERIDAFNVTPPNAWQKFKVGDVHWQHTTGWREHGKYRIIINLTRKFSPTRHVLVLPNGFRLEWHLEVAFRKKGFLGVWYNYRNNSDVTVNFRYFDESWNTLLRTQSMRNIVYGFMSSHDMYSNTYVIRHITPSLYDDWTNVYDYYRNFKTYPRCVYEMPGYIAEINASIGNFPYQRFGFMAPVLYGYTNYASDKLKE